MAKRYGICPVKCGADLTGSAALPAARSTIVRLQASLQLRRTSRRRRLASPASSKIAQIRIVKLVLYESWKMAKVRIKSTLKQLFLSKPKLRIKLSRSAGFCKISFHRSLIRNTMSNMGAIIPAHVNYPWDLSPKEAVALQMHLTGKVICESEVNIKNVETVAGIDTHYHDGTATAAVVTIRLQDLETIDYVTASKPVNFPYIPGLLAFREGPAIINALNKLNTSPDILIFDGQGIAHPRRFGLASHIGLLSEMPSVGCAKTWLSGIYEEPGIEKGSFSYLKDRDLTIGAVLRTRSRVKPVFVSVGHKVNLYDSINIILRCCQRYRLPEPIRRADKLARSGAI